MVKAETLSGPFVKSRHSCVSISFSPPMPEPIITPQRVRSSASKSSPLSVTASAEATSANWVKRSTRLASFGSMYPSVDQS